LSGKDFNGDFTKPAKRLSTWPMIGFRVLCPIWLWAPFTYKIDQDLVALGNRGADAYARDENGEFIVEGRGGPRNEKMLKFLLQWLRPEKWGKARKREIFRSGGVLVIDERPNRSKKNCAASIRARQWKSASRKIGETKA
jgi:hypothetical protein